MNSCPVSNTVRQASSAFEASNLHCDYAGIVMHAWCFFTGRSADLNFAQFKVRSHGAHFLPSPTTANRSSSSSQTASSLFTSPTLLIPSSLESKNITNRNAFQNSSQRSSATSWAAGGALLTCLHRRCLPAHCYSATQLACDP
jgi:hypothetical protein